MGEEGVKSKIGRLKQDYTFDQREAAKILIITSTTVLLFSVFSIINLESASTSISSADQNLSRVEGMISSEDYNDTIDALQDVQQGTISERMQYAAEFFTAAQSGTYSLDGVQATVDSMIGIYQWLVLLAVLGEVAGVSLLYV